MFSCDIRTVERKMMCRFARHHLHLQNFFPLFWFLCEFASRNAMGYCAFTRQLNQQNEKEEQNHSHQNDDVWFTRMRKSIWSCVFVCARFCPFHLLQSVELKIVFKLFTIANRKRRQAHRQWQNWKCSRSHERMYWETSRRRKNKFHTTCVLFSLSSTMALLFCFRSTAPFNPRSAFVSVIGQSTHEYAVRCGCGTKNFRRFAVVVRHRRHRVLKLFDVPFAATIFHAKRKLNGTHCSQRETN